MADACLASRSSAGAAVAAVATINRAKKFLKYMEKVGLKRVRLKCYMLLVWN